MAIGRTNAFSGGGGVGAVLTVTAPAGVTVSVSKDGKTKTKTADASGLAVFKGLATGTWTLTITNGVQTATRSVEITADYDEVIAFFSATINITYPAGSTCTCSDGTTTLTAPDTSGTWVCVVPNAGTWTVSSTNGSESTSEAVSITTDGQVKQIELAYVEVIFDASMLTTDTATALFKRLYPNFQTVTKENGYIKLASTAEVILPFYINDSFDVSGYSKLVVEGYSDSGDAVFGLSGSTTHNTTGSNVNQPSYDAKIAFPTSSQETPLPIGEITGARYFACHMPGGKNIYIKKIMLKM